MDQLLKCLERLEVDHHEYKGTDPFDLFSQFYNNVSARRKVKKFIQEFENRPIIIKINKTSTTVRKKGIVSFSNKDWNESLHLFTKALTTAENESEPYALALANRSAALFFMKEYEYCLIDIDRCLKSNYPDNLKYKIYIRKIQCYEKIGATDEAQQALQEGLDFISNNTSFSISDKDIYSDKLLNVKRSLLETDYIKLCKPTIPTITENNKFLGASTLVDLRYCSGKGRHVVAQQDLKVGNILFVEKAFAHAPTFDDDLDLPTDNCYYCLSHNKAPIPCSSCTLCLYCDEECKQKSWEESHRWECKGMSNAFWSSIGLGFPAFRCLLKGIPSKFDRSDDNQKYVKVFGSKTDNYKYVNKLCTHITERNKETFVHLAGVLIGYLENETTFFPWLSDKIEMRNDDKLKILVGGLLLKHAAQNTSNSSIIQHYKLTYYKYVPRELTAIATGLYPSVSMMNHSCKPNISLFYINDVVVVKANDSIAKGQEIFNCYGLDHRDQIDRLERLTMLADQYNFSCSCEVCKNPKLEVPALNSYRCPRCSGPIRPQELKCYDCDNMLDLSKVLPLEKKLEELAPGIELDIIEDKNVGKCYDIMQKIYWKYHTKFSICYGAFASDSILKGDFDKAMEYFNKVIECWKRRYGEYNRGVAVEIIGLLEILQVIPVRQSGAFQRNIRKLHKHAETIIHLNYPDHCVKYDAFKKLLQ